jgi:hypothetical protein
MDRQLKIDEPEEALGCAPQAKFKYQSDEDILKQKLKNLQKCAETQRLEAMNQYEKTQSKFEKNKNDPGAEDPECDPEEKADKETGEKEEERFDPSELKESMDGWQLYKRKKVHNAMIKRYIYSLDCDYTRNKVTVCAHINHIFDLYLCQRKPFMKTRADYLELRQQNLSYHNFRNTNSKNQQSVQFFRGKSQVSLEEHVGLRIGEFNNNLTNVVPQSIRYYEH